MVSSVGVAGGKFASTNQKHDPDLDSTMTHHQYGISALYPQTSFGGENSGGIEKSWLFAQASIIQDSVVPENIYTLP